MRIRLGAAVAIWSRSGPESCLLPSTHDRAAEITQISYNSNGEFRVMRNMKGFIYTQPTATTWFGRCRTLGPRKPQVFGSSGISPRRSCCLEVPGVVFGVGLEPWDVSALVRLDEYPEHSVDCVRFSVDGTKLVGRWASPRSTGETAGVWDTQTGRRILSIVPDDEVAVTAVALHPNKGFVAVAFGARVRVLDLPTGRCCAEFRLPKRSNCYELDFVTDGTILLVDYSESSECQRWFGIPQNRWFGIPQLKCSVWLVLTSCRLNPACATLTRLVAEDRATLESDLSATPSPV